MAVKIFARTPDEAVTEFWLNDDVVRIGSAADCDLPLAGVDPHALTVQHRRGDYYVFNRSSATIRIGEAAVAPGNSCRWEFDQEVQFPSGAALLLQSADAAAWQPPSVETDEFDEELSTDEPAETNKNTTKMVVLGICVLGIVYMLTSGSAAKASKSTTARFDELVAARMKEHTQSNPIARRVLSGLQRGRIAELRGDEATAKKNYGDVKDLLLTAKQTGGPTFLDVDQQTLDFVTERLPKLE